MRFPLERSAQADIAFSSLPMPFQIWENGTISTSTLLSAYQYIVNNGNVDILPFLQMWISIGCPGVALFVFANCLGGNTFLRKGSFPLDLPFFKDFYCRYRVQHWLPQCGGGMSQPALCAIAAIKVFGKKGGLGGEKNLSSERCSLPPNGSQRRT